MSETNKSDSNTFPKISVRRAHHMFPPSRYTYTYDRVEIENHRTYYINFTATPISEDKKKKSPFPNNLLKTIEKSYPWGKYVEGFVINKKKAVFKKYILLNNTDEAIEVGS